MALASLTILVMAMTAMTVVVVPAVVVAVVAVMMIVMMIMEVVMMEVVVAKHDDFVQMKLFHSYEMEHHFLMVAHLFVLE